MNEISLLSCFVVLSGYLLGSLSWPYIIGRLVLKADIREEGDGKISAAAIYKRAGLRPTLFAGFLDFSMGAISVILARAFNQSSVIVLATGLAAMAGHNWSVFLKFKGGQGASIIQGVLAALVFFPFVIGGIIAFICHRLTRNTFLSTVIWVVTVSFVLLIENIFTNKDNSFMLIIYPCVLVSLMFVKRFQLNRAVLLHRKS